MEGVGREREELTTWFIACLQQAAAAFTKSEIEKEEWKTEWRQGEALLMSAVFLKGPERYRWKLDFHLISQLYSI